MKTLARFVIRPVNKNDGPGDLILGTMFKAQDPELLKPGVVYEIQVIMDALIIRPVGPAAIGYDINTTYVPSCSWMHSVDHILEIAQGRHLLTRKEMGHD